MYGVSKITTAEDIMLVSYRGVQPATMAHKLAALAEAGVVVDMISQTAPRGGAISFSFTANGRDLDTAIRAFGGGDEAPLISGGYSKINLYGEEMVESVGVAARALSALTGQEIEIALITTSDLDISILVRQEDEDVCLATLREVYKL